MAGYTASETGEIVGALAADALGAGGGGGEVASREHAASVLHTVFANVAAHPDAPKYRHVRKGNATIAGALGVPGVYEILTAGGFRDAGDALEMPACVGGDVAAAAAAAVASYMHPASHAGTVEGASSIQHAGSAPPAEDAEYAARRARAAEHAAEIEARRVAERAERDRLLAEVHQDRREVAAEHKLHPTETEHAHATHFGATEVRIVASDPPST